jgi:MFS family permease
MGMSLTFNAAYTVFAGPLGAWSDRIGRRKLIIGGWLAYALVYLGSQFRKGAGRFGHYLDCMVYITLPLKGRQKH